MEFTGHHHTKSYKSINFNHASKAQNGNNMNKVIHLKGGNVRKQHIYILDDPYHWVVKLENKRAFFQSKK